jgi:hypothetical protein
MQKKRSVENRSRPKAQPSTSVSSGNAGSFNHIIDILISAALLAAIAEAARKALAVQTGDWLAAVAAKTLYFPAAVAAYFINILPRGTTSVWWKVAAVAALAARPLALAAGAALLSPGLHTRSSEAASAFGPMKLTFRVLSVAWLSFGPAAAAFGAAAGSSARGPISRRGALAALFVSATLLLSWLPPYSLPPKPACTLPAAVAGAAALAGDLQRQSKGGPLVGTLVVGPVAAASIAWCWPCRESSGGVKGPAGGDIGNSSREDGSPSVVWSCETVLGGRLAVAEGSLGGRFR